MKVRVSFSPEVMYLRAETFYKGIRVLFKRAYFPDIAGSIGTRPKIGISKLSERSFLAAG